MSVEDKKKLWQQRLDRYANWDTYKAERKARKDCRLIALKEFFDNLDYDLIKELGL